MMKRMVLCQILWLTSLAHAADGATTNEPTAPSAEPVTLDALVGAALENNYELNFYQAEIDAAKAGRQTAGLSANPELSGDAGRKTVEEAGLSDEGVAWSVSVRQPFEWPGRLGLRKAVANRDIELAELGLERFRAALAGQVRARAYGLFAAQEKAAAAREVAGRLTALREVLVQRDPAGVTPLLETHIIEATELNAQRTAGVAALAAQVALLELNTLRGGAPGEGLSVAEPLLIFHPPKDRDALLAAARTNNFEVRVRAIQLAQQGFRVNLAENERFPPVALGLSVSEERAGDTERVIALGLSVPLPLWESRTGPIKAEMARQAQAETSLRLAQREVERLVVEAALTYDTKVREMERWGPEAVARFREGAELADRHYRLGAVPVSTYVELQERYLEAIGSLLDTRNEALEAAVQLELLTGLPAPMENKAMPEKNP